ncbi:hypothetical protein PHYBLDRAFT_140663 [Phycomyces blakesleeanus NRRL 1555(-)]|uniref:MSP domain-containing protein n=1 Tax=Phycomyces blakesleeanus (strain ATCC 8743b / DSM 1359 / FGSC 10004 / NBRC 33097 / NRRL 1555) TaxID=763407 RepID=A0A162Y6K8_PHYB8|nr:hypothetical protein PHYBLDRAFT_140663 [Phycomyces blakesleeanus NRRL 1555(-)]OAD78595.1 hypothetical protein PHYBLDRAFT_140663 [Phycomyces blakesleeanus NRRL 1555(-)]|eukprot:XP_018296635.1 hypothetical protein PHYBLDRAFT_140663 [Phycomyces blakesleeanus NRRL 1555(-)]
MTQSDAASLHSQTSTKSSRSFLSFLSRESQSNKGAWSTLRQWSPHKPAAYSKLKRLFVSSGNTEDSPTLNSRPVSLDSASTSRTYPTPGIPSILWNRGDESEEAIAELNNRRHQRRLYLIRAQKCRPSRFHTHNNDSDIDDIEEQPRVTFDNISQHHSNSSSSSSTLTNPDVMVENNELKDMDHKVTFVIPSPVPRFRNVPPLPPSSPPYMTVDTIPIPPEMAKVERRKSLVRRIDTTQAEPTIYTPAIPQHVEPSVEEGEEASSPPSNDSLNNSPLLFPLPCFRGQSITLGLNNTHPDHYILIFKFLTGNNSTRPSVRHSIATIPMVLKRSSEAPSPRDIQAERYFIKPSAGMIRTGARFPITLFLNNPPGISQGDVLKDKILVRWAMIQKNTKVAAWALELPEESRRKWLEMLIQQWPDQIVVRETKIYIQFK